MRQLLATNTLRQLQLIETLFESDDWLTIGQLAKTLGCSTRVINIDILAINTEFSPFSIETSLKKGVLLEYPDTVSIDLIYRKVLHNSLEFILLELLFFESCLSTDDLCDELHVSHSTLSRMLARLKPILQKQAISIHTSPYFLTGDEHTIRNLFVHLLLEKYAGDALPFDVTQLALADKLVRALANATQTPLNFPDLKLLRVILLVNLTRVRHDHNVTTNALVDHEDETIAQLIDDPLLAQAVYKYFGVTLSVAIVKDLISVFIVREFIRDPDALAGEVYLPTTHDSFHAISNFLDTFAKKYDLIINNHSVVAKELFNLQLLSFGNNYILFDKTAQFARQIASDYPKFYTLLVHELRAFKFDEAFQWTEMSFNAALYTIVIHWDNLLEELTRKMTPLKIGIFCDYDLEHSQSIQKLVRHHFGNQVDVTIFEALTEAEAYHESRTYDVLLTNMSDLRHQSAAVICINSVLTDHDWKSLWVLISKNNDAHNLIAAKMLV